MHVPRFGDVVASGCARVRRVFIRADLKVPQDDAGRITEDTRIRASVPCIRLALEAGAAVMVSAHVNEGEKKNDAALARKRAARCDIFVHDAFGTAHRAEAGTYGIAQYAPIACAGPLPAFEILARRAEA